MVLTRLRFNSQNKPIYSLDFAHCFIVYFHEKLLYLFNTVEKKKINLLIDFTRVH